MEKRLKVWTYREGEPPLAHVGPLVSIYSIEGHFISEMESGESRFAARHPEEANVFFLPFSVTNMVSYAYKRTVPRQERPVKKLALDYARVVSNKHPFWNRTDGADHFIVSCHDWVSFAPQRDASMPEINIKHRRLVLSDRDTPLTKRTTLAFFAGGLHGAIRESLLRHWEGKDDEVRVYKRLPDGMNYDESMRTSRFCLCPSGWEVASPRVVEAIHAGCVPVIISDGYVPPFDDVLDWGKFTVRVPVEGIPEIKAVLKGISMRRYVSLRARVLQARAHFVINRPPKRFDVLHMVLHSVWLRRLNLRLSY
ncbi:putative glycosyltransferase [Acorus gramineus]|uniref:Glycosyltransferase n=1 Tax=Acorus gramineus TaxID=55184 RepID=A0AAV9AY21_ACOGR|nr:putative glycosyltransferase [Acorus gramineus]